MNIYNIIAILLVICLASTYYQNIKKIRFNHVLLALIAIVIGCSFMKMNKVEGLCVLTTAGAQGRASGSEDPCIPFDSDQDGCTNEATRSCQYVDYVGGIVINFRTAMKYINLNYPRMQDYLAWIGGRTGGALESARQLGFQGVCTTTSDCMTSTYASPHVIPAEVCDIPNGVCNIACSDDAICTTLGMVCDQTNGVCIPDPACTINTDCRYDESCDIPNGVCIRNQQAPNPQPPPIADLCASANCPADNICDPATGSCTPNPSLSQGGGDLCASANCSADNICDPATGSCIPNPSLSQGGDNTCTTDAQCTAQEVCNNSVCITDPSTNADKTGFKLTGRNGGSIKKNVFYTDYYCSESTPGDSDYIECDDNTTPNSNNFDKLFAWLFDVSDSRAKNECCN